MATSTVQVTLVRDGIGVVGGAEAADVTARAARSGLDPAFRGGSGRAWGAGLSTRTGGAGGGGADAWAGGDGSGRTGGRAEAGGGAGGDDGAGGNGDSSKLTAPGSSGAPTGVWPAGAVDDHGGPADEGSGPVGDDSGLAGGGSGLAGEGRGRAGVGRGSGLLQAVKGSSGFEIGGNSDSGGPDGARLDGDVARGSAEPAGTGDDDSAGWPRGAKGRRAETRTPHASQD